MVTIDGTLRATLGNAQRMLKNEILKKLFVFPVGEQLKNIFF